MKHPDDFVALSGEQESGWLDGIVEDTLTWILPRTIMRVKHLPSLPFPSSITIRSKNSQQESPSDLLLSLYLL